MKSKNRFFYALVIFLSLYTVNVSIAQPWRDDIMVDVRRDRIEIATQILGDMQEIELEDPLQDNPPCYGENSSGCTSWSEWFQANAVVVHPDFDCEIGVKYKYRRCISNQNLVEIYIMTFATLNNYQYSCERFNDYLNSGDDYDKSQRHAQILHDIYALLSKGIFISFNELLMNDQITPDTLYCDNYNTQVKISYIKADCQSTCVGLVKYEPHGKAKDWLFRFPGLCPGSGCCKVENHFCIDRQTKKLIHNENTVPLSNSQNCGATPPLEDCNKKFPPEMPVIETWQTKCSQACKLTNFNLGGELIIK